MNYRLFFVLLLASFSKVHAQKLYAEKIPIKTATAAHPQNTLIYLPAGYSKDKAYPIVIYLHGNGQAGTDINKLYATGLPRVLRNGYKPPFDFIMLAPQSDRYGVPPQWLPELLNQAQKQFAIDTNRIYLTGIDAGGWAAYGSQLDAPAAASYKIAAIATIAAATQNNNISTVTHWASNQTPLLAITGKEDPGYTRRNTALVSELNKALPGLATTLALPGVAHGGWDNVYQGRVTVEGKTIWQWLQQFDRSRPFSKVHTSGATSIAGISDTLSSLTTSTSSVPFYSNTHIEAEKFASRSGVLMQTTKDFAGGDLNSFDMNYADWLSYNVNAPASGYYTLCFRLACNASGAKFYIKNSGGTVLTTVSVPVTNGWQTWRDVTAVIYLAAGKQSIKFQSASSSGWNMNYFEIVKTPLNAFASYTLRRNSGESIYLPQGFNLAHLKPGDTLNIMGGAYDVIELGKFKGSATNPLIIRNKGGQVTCKIIRLSNVPEYFKLMGNGYSGVTYGFKINGGYSSGSCLTAFGKYFTIAYVEATQSKSGFFIKKNPVSGDKMSQYPYYEMTKVTILHNYIHDITGEGMYIGHTAPDGGQGGNPLLPVRMRNVEIAYNTVTRTGWDGIQLSNATTGNKIHHNTVTNFGTTNTYGQQAGIIMGGNSQGDIYNNVIKSGTGNGIQDFGFGLNKIYSNYLEKVGYNGTDRGVEGVYCNDILVKSESRPKQQITASNNVIKYPKPWGAVRVSGYNNNSLPATMQYNKVLLTSATSDWQKKYFPTYVAHSVISNNSLISQ